MVKQNPVAWIAFAADASESAAVYTTQAEARADADDWNWCVAPLYRAPTLTDEEREAIEWAINDQIEGGWENHETVKDVISALRGLLKRAK